MFSFQEWIICNNRIIRFPFALKNKNYQMKTEFLLWQSGLKSIWLQWLGSLWRSRFLAQCCGLKDLVLPQLRCMSQLGLGLNPWLANFYTARVQLLKKKKKKRKKVKITSCHCLSIILALRWVNLKMMKTSEIKGERIWLLKSSLHVSEI